MGNQMGTCLVCNNQDKLTNCEVCQRKVCQKCYDFPLLRKPEQNAALNNVEYIAACRECFISKTALDFTKNYQIIGSEGKNQIIFLHGAGSSRNMFRSHAKILAEKGYKCILIDLPGHGSRLDEALTLQNCETVIKQTVEQLCKSKNVTIVGGSLGGYILMEVLGRNNDLCSKAVIMMCGQNVGVNRGKKASFGLWAMNKAMNLMSQVTIAKQFLNSTSGNKDLNKQIVLELLQSGTYFKHADENIFLLKNGNYEQSLQNTHKKIKFLFINGEKDYRDSQQIWLNAVSQGSKSLVYQKGDHFFSHDNRFFNRLIEDISNFMQQP